MLPVVDPISKLTPSKTLIAVPPRQTVGNVAEPPPPPTTPTVTDESIIPRLTKAETTFVFVGLVIGVAPKKPRQVEVASEICPVP